MSGKSTLGLKLAAATGSPFVDLDLRIEASQGMSISGIFAQKGVEAFRLLEREALGAVLTIPGVVVATGGGIVESDLKQLLDGHRVLYLFCERDEAISRLMAHPRPLQSGPVEFSSLSDFQAAQTAQYDALWSRRGALYEALGGTMILTS
ncbi:shikimate kinase, partial [Myxococcota bacterium]|nr:shikimate kinase [Myxococcota bacterium]